jgi:arylsulfatase A-like enzyme
MLAERALVAEQLGTRDTTDVLAVSFSSNDKVGHDYGTFSPEEHDVTVQTDRILARLFDAIDRQVGMNNVLVVLTGDHGVAPSAEEAKTNRMPGGRIPGDTVKNAVTAALTRQYGPGQWVAGSWDLSIYLNWKFIESKSLSPTEVSRVAAAAAMDVPHVARVYTRDQLASGALALDAFAQRIVNGFNLRRAADLVFVPEPYWTFTTSTSTHGTPFGYDTHVPVIFMGAGIKPGNQDANIAVNDIAPTLAAILRVETPSGSVGRVLAEMFE